MICISIHGDSHWNEKQNKTKQKPTTVTATRRSTEQILHNHQP